MIKLKRIYDRKSSSDGKRYLIERLWPRGIKKSSLPLNAWLKDAGPSTDLRRWFGHDPGKWNRFCDKYFEELDANPAAWAPILAAVRNGNATLLYSSRDLEHNNAVALKSYLEQKLQKIAKPKHKPTSGAGT